MNTIITYYSDSGSTAEVGQTIIKQNNCRYVSIAELLKQDKLDCNKLIIGSPNKFGKLVPDIVKLLQKHKRELSKIPIIIFFTCMDFCIDKNSSVKFDYWVDSHFRNNIKEELSNWDKQHSLTAYIENINKVVAGLNIQSLAFFKGRLNFKKLRFFEALVMKFICLTNRNIKQGDYLNKDDALEWSRSLQL